MNKKILMGYVFSHIRNLTSLVDVRFYGGATFVISYNKYTGVTIGNYINIYDNSDKARELNKDFTPEGRPLYMHEYGHYLQSKVYGSSYLFVIGLPSLMSAWTSKEIEGSEASTHNYRWYEMNANWRAMEYFNIERNTWETSKIYERYPLEDTREK